MINYCPNCSNKLEKDFKFCPSCGYDLTSLSSQNGIVDNEQSSLNEEETKVLLCDICGEENDLSDSFCNGCGAKLQDSSAAKVRKKKNEAVDGDNLKKIHKKNKKSAAGKTTKTNLPSGGNKSINSNQLLLIVLIVVVVILGIMIATGSFNTEKNDFAGNQNFSSGISLNNLKEIQLLEERVKANPNDMESLLSLAHLRNDSGMYSKAIENYQAYLKVHPENSDARVDMGVCYFNLRDYDNAIRVMEEALKYTPNHQIAHLNLGVVNLNAGNINEAKKWLQKAVDLNPVNEIGQKAKQLLESNIN